MPYDARYAVMSVRKNILRESGWYHGLYVSSLWGGAFLCQSMQEKLPVASSLAYPKAYADIKICEERKKMMKEKLQNIKEEALKAIEAADMPEKLNDVRVKFLGKKVNLPLY